MTVRELKEALAAYPDDMEVVARCDDYEAVDGSRDFSITYVDWCPRAGSWIYGGEENHYVVALGTDITL